MNEADLVRVLVTVAALVATGLALAADLPRRLALEPRICRAIVIIYAIKVAFVFAVFAASISGWELLDEFVAGPGLWYAFPDAINYHDLGIAEAEALKRGLAFQAADGYPAIVSTLYASVGMNPLVAVLLNPVADVMTLTGLVLLMQHVSGRVVPVWIVWVVGLWPSWIVWSTQLLKDSLLLGCCVGALLLVTSVFERSSDAKALRKYWLLEWPVFMMLVAWAALFRSAVADVLTAAGGIAAAWAVARAMTRRTGWQTAAVALAAAIAVFAGQSFLRGAFMSATSQEAGIGYFNLGLAYEREGNIEQARNAYGMALLFVPEYSTVVQERLSASERGEAARAPSATPGPGDFLDQGDAPTVSVSPAPAATTRTVVESLERLRTRLHETFWSFVARIDLRRLANLRKGNLFGVTQFAADGDVSTVGGALGLLPIGLAHAMFGPFPGVVFGPPGASGALRYFSLIELPAIVFIVVMGMVGTFMSLRRATPVCVLLGSFAALGLLALALTVPNDGLLFRYRLPFVGALVAFIPLGVERTRDMAAAITRRVAAGPATS